MNEFIETLKVQILAHLRLTHVKPEEIDPAAPLFGGPPLELDSIDALELMMFMEKNYGVRIEDSKEGRRVLQSLQTMADYILEKRKQPAA